MELLLGDDETCRIPTAVGTAGEAEITYEHAMKWRML